MVHVCLFTYQNTTKLVLFFPTKNGKILKNHWNLTVKLEILFKKRHIPLSKTNLPVVNPNRQYDQRTQISLKD